MYVLGTEPGTAATSASALNHVAISPALNKHFYKLDFGFGEAGCQTGIYTKWFAEMQGCTFSYLLFATKYIMNVDEC